MSTKRYCDFCSDELSFSGRGSFYLDMDNSRGVGIRVRAEVTAVSLFKPMIGKTRERQLSDPDICLSCMRRIVLEGTML